MSAWIKRVAFLIVALLIFSLVGIAVFFLTFNPNAYKDKLEEFVYQRYERHLEIGGEIELSLFPRIGLSVESVRLSEKGTERPFAAVSLMRFSVAVWPLLWNRLVIDHLSLKGVQAWFELGTTSKDNLPVMQPKRQIKGEQQIEKPKVENNLANAFLSNAQAQPQQLEDAVLPRLQRSEFQVDISGLDIQDATFYLFDPERQWTAELTDVAINTGRVTMGQPFDLVVKGAMSSNRFMADLQFDGQGVLQLEPAARRLVVHRSHIHYSGLFNNFLINQGTLRGSLEYLYRQAIDLEQLELLAQGRWQGAYPQETAELALRAQSLGVHWGIEQLWWDGLHIRATSKNKTQQNDFAVESPQLRVSATETKAQPIKASIRHAQGKKVLGLNLNMQGFNAGWQALKIDDFSVKAQYQNSHQNWQLNLDSVLQWEHENRQLLFEQTQGRLSLSDDALIDGQTERKLKGNFYIEPFNGHAAGDLYAYLPKQQETESAYSEYLTWLAWFDEENTPARLITNLEAKTLDLSQWLPAAQVRAERARKDAPGKKITLETPTQDSALIHLDDTKDLSWFALPFDWSWTVQANKFRFDQLWLEHLQAHGHWQQKALELNEFKAFLHDGYIQAHLAWLNNSQLQGYVQLENIDAAAFLAGLEIQPFIQGTTQLEATWHTQGGTWPAWLAHLNAHVKADIEDGAFMGFSLWNQVDAAYRALQKVASKEPSTMPESFNAQVLTPFDDLAIEMSGLNGQLSFDEFNLVAPDYSLEKGDPAWLDLANGQLDLMLLLDLHLQNPQEHELHRVDFAQAQIPLRVTGQIIDPKMRFQWSSLRHRFVQEAIDKGLLDNLGYPEHATILAKTQTKQPMVKSLVEGTVRYLGATLKEFLRRKH